MWYFLLIILSWLPILAEHTTAVLLLNYFSYFTLGPILIESKWSFVVKNDFERKREKQKQFKGSFLLKSFLLPLFYVFRFYYYDFFLLPFSILHFFLSVCLSVCAIFVLLFICVFKSVSAYTHNISHIFHLFSWMNEWLFYLCFCSFCVIVLSVWLSFCQFAKKGVNKFVFNK